MLDQVNAITNEPYQGKNAVTLAVAYVELGYPTNVWLTFKQALSIGRCVRKGEHGVRIIKLVQDKNDEKRKGVRGYTVFNIAQTDELPARVDEPVTA